MEPIDPRSRPAEAPGVRPGARVACLGLLRRREAWRLTWRAWGLLGLGLLALGLTIRTTLEPFLATTQRVAASHLVVEGWLPDYALKEAAEEFARGQYRGIFCTGGPLERGSMLSEYHTYAEVAGAMLRRYGVPAEAVLVVPAQPVRRGRTWASAVELRETLASQHIAVDGLNVFTVGCHARRSRLLFWRALQGRTPVGIIAVQPADYDVKRWWQSSYGVKDVMGEAAAYCGELLDY